MSKNFEYIALTKEPNGWRIGTFDENGVIQERECSNIDGMVNCIIEWYGMKPAEVRQIPGAYNVLRSRPSGLVGF